MSVVITRDDIIAYAEVDYIIHHMNEKYIKKVPEKLLNFFSNIKDPEHEIYINPRVPLQEQNLKKYTLEIIALLHLKYWCEDEERRNMLYEKMMENQRKLDEQMHEKYNFDNMFELNSAKVVTSEADISKESNYDYSKISNSTIQHESDETNTDVKKDKLINYIDKDNKIEEIAISNKTNFFVKFLNKVKNIFKKNKRRLTSFIFLF